MVKQCCNQCGFSHNQQKSLYRAPQNWKVLKSHRWTPKYHQSKIPAAVIAEIAVCWVHYLHFLVTTCLDTRSGCTLAFSGFGPSRSPTLPSQNGWWQQMITCFMRSKGCVSIYDLLQCHRSESFDRLLGHQSKHALNQVSGLAIPRLCSVLAPASAGS